MRTSLRIAAGDRSKVLVTGPNEMGVFVSYFLADSELIQTT